MISLRGTVGRAIRDRLAEVLLDFEVVQQRIGPGSESIPAPRGTVLVDLGRGLHVRWGTCAPCLYLVRPDGHVGYRARSSDSALLARYLERIFLE